MGAKVRISFQIQHPVTHTHTLKTTVLRRSFLKSKSSWKVLSLKFFINRLLLRTRSREMAADTTQGRKWRAAIVWQSPFPSLKNRWESKSNASWRFTWSIGFQTDDQMANYEKLVSKQTRIRSSNHPWAERSFDRNRRSVLIRRMKRPTWWSPESWIDC